MRRPDLLIWLLAVVAGLVGLGVRNQAKESANERKLPPGELGRVIELGRKLVERTNEHPLTKGLVGNDLRCTSCHLDAGTDPAAASFLGVATAYPAWSPREERVITLEDRIANCFMRSLNGTRPVNGTEVPVAIAAYITWLSSGERIAMNPMGPLGPRSLKPLSIDIETANVERGKLLYADHCAVCHGENGAGNEDGPAVWGDRSYNDGAGMSHNAKLGAWLKVAMPLGDPYLTEQEALDIAAFVNSHPRPKFVLEEHLGEQKQPAQGDAR